MRRSHDSYKHKAEREKPETKEDRRTDGPDPEQVQGLGGGRVKIVRDEIKWMVAQHSVVETVGAYAAKWRILCCAVDISTFQMPLRQRRCGLTIFSEF